MANYGANDAGSTLQRSLAGASPAATDPASKYRVGTRLWDDTGLKSWQMTMNVAGTAKIWTQLTGAGTPGNAWPNYVVSNDPNVPAPYTNIQDAVDAVIANGSTTAAVLIHPGTYGGDVTIPRDGIALVGIGQAASLGAVIVGNVTATGVSNGTFGFAGIAVNGQVTIAGSVFLATFDHVVIIPTGTQRGIYWTAGLGTLAIEGFSVVQHESGPSIETTGPTQMFINDVEMLGPDNVPALILVGGGTISFDNNQVEGQALLSDGITFVANASTFQATGTSVIDVEAGSIATTNGCEFNTATTPTISGSGTFVAQFAESHTGSITVAATLATSATLALYQHKSTTATYAGVDVPFPTNVDTLYVDTGAFAPATVLLPPLTSILDGVDLTIKSSVAVGTLRISGNGSNIDDAATQTTATAYGSFTVRADPAAGQWRVVSQF